MKKQKVLFVLMLLPMLASAYDAEINGIYYNLIPKGHVAEVTYQRNEKYGDPMYYSPYTNEVIIPEKFTYEGVDYSVKNIGNSAFWCCTSLTSVIIPNTVINIYDDAFTGCTGLTSVTIPNSVTSIGQQAFYCCSGLTSVTIGNSVNSIGHSAFLGCTSLTSIDLPNSVTTIGDCAFDYCSGLTSLTIPNSVTSIKHYAFKNCTSLNSVTISNSIMSIEYGVFRECSNLTSVTIPNSVTSIESEAFYYCTSLASVTIPNSVTNIGGIAFAYCNNLEKVYCYAEEVPSTSKSAFNESLIEYATLYVPAKSIEAYKTKAPWSQFGSIIALPTLSYIIDGITYKVTEPIIGDIITPEPEPSKEGYTFSGWSEIPSTMPDHDVTVTGSFTINKYKLTYKVDDADYKSYDVEYNTAITPEEVPTKEGYTFSGWSEIPETMPANDITITGTFKVNKYNLTYMVDGEEYKSVEVEYGTAITPEGTPMKDGYTFSGWSEIPSIMPANDVTITGTFTANNYKLIYNVDGEEYKSYVMECGANITPETAPTKEGYTFSGWSEIPSTMPANDVTVTGTFTINKYTITYMIDGAVFKTVEVEYNSAITPPDAPAKEGYDFAWADVPETMPAKDITINGSYTTGIKSVNGSQSPDDAPVYNLNGQRVSKAAKGVYIKNGKKVLVK